MEAGWCHNTLQQLDISIVGEGRPAEQSDRMIREILGFIAIA